MDDGSFGLLRIGGVLLALPVMAIREVIPGQAAYGALPVKAEGLLGAVDLRGTIIPVLDLSTTLGLSSDGRAAHVVVIMRWEGHLVGLTADGVSGIAHPAPGTLFTLNTASPRLAGMLATHTFQSNGEIATVLDTKGIANLPNVPLVAETFAERAASAVASTESLLQFRYGECNFGIDATCVDATVSALRIERNALATGYCLGVIEHHGYEVAVVDTMAAIGLRSGQPAPETSVIVVRFSGQAMLGFAIDEVRDIVRVPGADILPLPALSTGTASFFRGMLARPGLRQTLLLDIDRLCTDPALLSLAQLRKPRRAAPGEPGGGSAHGAAAAKPAQPTQSYLTYTAGADLATPLQQVLEILHYPADISPIECDGLGMLGLFSHRNRVVPLVCLGTLLGQPMTLDSSIARVLLVENAGHTLGFAVQSLYSVEQASLHSLMGEPSSAERTLFNSVVLLGTGTDRRTACHVDLLAEVLQFYRPDRRVEKPGTVMVPARRAVAEEVAV